LEIVLSGHTSAVNHALLSLNSSGVRIRSVPLNVSAPFHSELMKPAADILREEFKNNYFYFKNPLVPIISNTSAQVENDIDKIVSLLIQQITSPVEWYKCVLEAKKIFGVTTYIEVGPTPTLLPLISKIQQECKMRFLGTSQDIEMFN